MEEVGGRSWEWGQWKIEDGVYNCRMQDIDEGGGDAWGV